MLNGALKVQFFIDKSLGMFKNLDCSIGLINSKNIIIFKFRNSEFYLKDNFVNN